MEGGAGEETFFQKRRFPRIYINTPTNQNLKHMLPHKKREPFLKGSLFYNNNVILILFNNECRRGYEIDGNGHKDEHWRGVELFGVKSRDGIEEGYG